MHKYVHPVHEFTSTPVASVRINKCIYFMVMFGHVPAKGLCVWQIYFKPEIVQEATITFARTPSL